MVTVLARFAASRPAVDLLIRALAIALVAFAIFVGLPVVAVLAG